MKRFKWIEHKQGTVKDDILSGLTVAIALVPEAVAFAFIAGVSPIVGLYGAFMMGLVTSIIGGRPGMISGATGALAVVMVELAEAWVYETPDGRVPEPSIAMLERALDLDPNTADIRVVISGHTHQAAAVQSNGVLFLNPGSPAAPRYGTDASVAMLRVDQGRLRYHFIEVE